MTERSMTEGELREAIAEIVAGHYGRVGLSNAECYPAADKILAVLRPHLVGVTEEQREALDHAIDIVREITISSPDGEEQADAEQTLSGLVSLRAIAGRGEGTAEG